MQRLEDMFAEFPSVEVKKSANETKSVPVYSRPLLTIPEQVELTDVDERGRLIVPDEKLVRQCIQEKIDRELIDAKDDPEAIALAKEGVLRAWESKLKYDVVYKGEMVGYIYPGKIGEGVSGVVRLCYHDGGWSVLKFPKEVPLSDEEFLISKEVKLATNEIGYCTQKILMMKWLPGISLEDFTLSFRNSTIPPMQRYKLTQVMINGQQNLQAMRIAHLDLKPGNLMLWGNELTAFDYGFSRLLSHSDSKMRIKVQGTPCYMAPEFFDQSNIVCVFKMDDFSLGMILGELYDFWQTHFKNTVEDADQNPERYLPNVFGCKDRFISDTSEEFKNNRACPDEITRKKLLDLFKKMIAANPLHRPSLEDCKRVIDPIYEASRFEPVLKAIVDVDELLELKDPVQIKYFKNALALMDVVLLAESKEHTVVEYSKVARLLARANVSTEVFYAKEKSSILDVIAGIPVKETGSETDCTAYYVAVTNKRWKVIPSADCNVVSIHPVNIILGMAGSSELVYRSQISQCKSTVFAKVRELPGIMPHQYIAPRRDR